MNRLVLILIIFSVLTGCFEIKSTFDQNGKIQNLGTPIKVEYFKALPDKAFCHSDTATFVVTDQKELKTIIDEIRNADNPEPWKGAGWNVIIISYTDTVLSINTNNERIGLRSSGAFYSLGKENFISKRLNQK